MKVLATAVFIVPGFPINLGFYGAAQRRVE